MEQKYAGTYSVRKIGKSEQGIHMPSDISGNYSIYVEDHGKVIRLVRQ